MVIKQRDPSIYLKSITIVRLLDLQTGKVPDSFLIYRPVHPGDRGFADDEKSCDPSFKKQTISARTSIELWLLIVTN